MPLTIHRGPAHGAADAAAGAAWRARGGLLVVRDRDAASAALRAEAAAAPVLDREATTLAGLRARVLRTAGLGEGPAPASAVEVRLALQDAVAQR
ncbi:MAG: hypothetical protein AB1416_04535, partial [Actinomycetota bacterium]